MKAQAKVTTYNTLVETCDNSITEEADVYCTRNRELVIYVGCIRVQINFTPEEHTNFMYAMRVVSELDEEFKALAVLEPAPLIEVEELTAEQVEEAEKYHDQVFKTVLGEEDFTSCDPKDIFAEPKKRKEAVNE